MRDLGLRTRASYTASYMRCVALIVKHAKDSEFEKALHSCETGAEDPKVCLKGGQDAEADEIIWKMVSCFTPAEFWVRSHVKSAECWWTAMVFKRRVAAIMTLESARQRNT